MTPIDIARAAVAEQAHAYAAWIAALREYTDACETWAKANTDALYADLDAYHGGDEGKASIGIAVSRACWQMEECARRVDVAMRARNEADHARMLAVGTLP